MRDDLLTASRPELLDKGDDRMLRALLHDYFAFGRNLEAARAKFAAQVGLSPTQYMILIVIAHALKDDAPGIGQIADRLHLSGAFVTTEVNGLEADGLVRKDAHPSDRRRVMLFATEAGMDRLKQLAAFQRPVNDALFGMLSREEVRLLAGLLARLAANGDAALKLADYVEARMDLARRGDRAPKVTSAPPIRTPIKRRTRG
jgi:DNA-binding MarR family transcriptional regulator